MKITSVINKKALETLKKSIEVPYRELRLSDHLGFIFFEIGSEPYYIKVVG
jgi:hypothetical protein